MEANFHKGADTWHQFVLRQTEDGWKVDEVKYRFSGEETWHNYHI